MNLLLPRAARIRAPAVRAGAALALCAALSAAAPAAAHPEASLAERVTADSLLFARAVVAQRFDTVLAAVHRDIPLARASGDGRALAQLLRFQGIALAMSGSGNVAPAPLDEALALSLAQRDTAQAMVALRWRTYVAGMLGDYARQEVLADSLLRLSRAARNERLQSVALNFSGWLAMRRGNLAVARSHLDQAVAIQRRLGLEDDEAIALTTLGNVLRSQGELDRARAVYARQLDIARRRNLTWSVAQAFAELGSLEIQSGDPALAAQYFERARAGHCGAGETYDCASAIFNIASTEVAIGRPEAAIAVAREGAAMADRRGYAHLRAAFRMQVARVEFERGRMGASRAAWESLRELGDEADPDTWAQAALGIARVLSRENRFEEAVAVERDALARWGSRIPASTALAMRADLLGVLGRAGHGPEAASEGPAVAREAEAMGFPRIAVVAWQNVAVALWWEGRASEATRACDEVQRLVEVERAGSVDPAWRERLGEMAAEAAVSSALIYLQDSAVAADSSREAAAWTALQRIRTRTLVERMSGPHGAQDGPPMRPPQVIGLSELQRGVLGDGELLLEWVTSREATLLFAVAKDTRRAIRLPGAKALGDSIALALDVLAARGESGPDRAAAAAVGRALARVLFGGCEDLVARSHTLLVAPDGPIFRVPFAALAIAERPLVEDHSIVVVPSGVVLAEIRRRAGHAAAGTGLLAFYSEPAKGEPSLRGARREVAWLGASFRDVERGSAAPSSPALRAADLTRFDALHFAGHTHVDDRSPWQSGIVLRSERVIGDSAATAAAGLRSASDTAPSGAGHTDEFQSGFLTADRISRLPLAARLVVLASCESGGGRARAGEGLAGLSSAFIAGGANTVIATLWPVDDAVAETLMRAFYRRLAAGEAAASALRAAQLQVRSGASTRHPYYWAGWVLIGEGGTRLALRPRGFPGGPLALSGVLALALALGALLAAVRRRPGRNGSA